MKSTQKGNSYEREVRDILLREKWLVEGQHRKVSYIKDKFTGQMKLIMAGRDIYGCDLIAKKPFEKTRWIQVSTVPQKSVKAKQVLQFPWNLNHEDVELWLRVHGKRMFRIFKRTLACDAVGMGLTNEDQWVECEEKYVKGDDNEEIEYPEGLEHVEKTIAERNPR